MCRVVLMVTTIPFQIQSYFHHPRKFPGIPFQSIPISPPLEETACLISIIRLCASSISVY